MRELAVVRAVEQCLSDRLPLSACDLRPSRLPARRRHVLVGRENREVQNGEEGGGGESSFLIEARRILTVNSKNNMQSV